MLKRKITEQIEHWVRTKEKKCLLVQGPRQTGKTYTIEQFAAAHYEEVLTIDFREMPEAREIFAGEMTVEKMVMAMRFRFPEKKIVPGKTLLFLDEIQECPEAMRSLQVWALDNQYDVIAAGMMLGVDLDQKNSHFFQNVDVLTMHGLDFEEFLWGIGISEMMIRILRGYFVSKMSIPEVIHSQMMNIYRKYIAIGGMPEAVQLYFDTKDFREVDRVQKDILQKYRYDIAQYAVAEEKGKAEKCYLSLAKQLLEKGNRKFQYKEVEHGGRAQKYFSSIEWLEQADMIHLSKNVSEIRGDLEHYAKKNFFRAYPTDLTLFIAMKPFSFKQHIVENTLTGTEKHGMLECAIADALYKQGYPLYFYKNGTTKKEIDILLQRGRQILPLEIKTGNTRTYFLKSLIQENEEIPYGYRFAEENIHVGADGMITLPFYMAAFLK